MKLFGDLFGGREDIYGTYDVRTGKVWQVKQPVTDKVIADHISGQRPFGVYLLRKDRIRAAAVDFDNDDPRLPINFTAQAAAYEMPAYIERSKSKGYHVWVFFSRQGVMANSVRLVLKMLLEEIGQPLTEIFPKQDWLKNGSYGNFINAPLFGGLVSRGRTVFLDNRCREIDDQWAFLDRLQRVSPQMITELVEINELSSAAADANRRDDAVSDLEFRTFGLRPCAQRMLREGVISYQRISCFWLAVQLRKAGIPRDVTVSALLEWAKQNHPTDGKEVISRDEVLKQTASAYTRTYRGCGCESQAMIPFCDPSCRLGKGMKS